MAGPEAEIERKCARIAREAGCMLLKIRFLDRVGCPDRLLIVPRGTVPHAVMVEFKRPGARPSKVQRRVHRELEDDGAVVWVIDDVEQFRGELTTLL